MEIVESQALMEDNAALLPQGDGCIREHRSVNITDFNPLTADDPDEFLLDNGDGFITVYRSKVRGQLQQSHKLPKSLWTTFAQDEKRIWLSFSVDTRRRILGCLDNEPSDQQNEDQASPMSSAVRQHAQPRHQSRLRSYNLRPINGQPHRNNQQRRVRLTDRYDLIGEPGNGGGDNNQDINVRLLNQYNTAGESNAVTTGEVATDEIVPRPNTELDVGTAMFATNATSSSAGTATDTLFINNIKSSSSNSPAVTRNPFDVRRLLEDSPPSSDVASEDGELAPYCPVPISQPSSDGDDVPTSSTSKLKSTKSILRKPSFKKNKKRGIPSVMNAFVTILSCVCLFGCLPHLSASPFNEIPLPDLECNTVEFVDVDNAASRYTSCRNQG